MLLSENIHFVKGLDPVADALASTVTTDVVKMAEYAGAAWVIHKGVGATGTSTITVEACDNAAGDNPVAVAFRYRAITSGDTHGSLTAATSAGFALTAGSSQLYVVEVDADVIAAAGKGWVRLKAAEVVDSAVLAGILCMLYGARYGDQHNTAIA